MFEVSEFLRDSAQHMVGARLTEAVVELDLDIEGLLEVRSRLLEVSEFLRDYAQLMVDSSEYRLLALSIDFTALYERNKRLIRFSGF